MSLLVTNRWLKSLRTVRLNQTRRKYSGAVLLIFFSRFFFFFFFFFWGGGHYDGKKMHRKRLHNMKPRCSERVRGTGFDFQLVFEVQRYLDQSNLYFCHISSKRGLQLIEAPSFAHSKNDPDIFRCSEYVSSGGGDRR